MTIIPFNIILLYYINIRRIININSNISLSFTIPVGLATHSTMHAFFIKEFGDGSIYITNTNA